MNTELIKILSEEKQKLVEVELVPTFFSGYEDRLLLMHFFEDRIFYNLTKSCRWQPSDSTDLYLLELINWRPSIFYCPHHLAFIEVFESSAAVKRFNVLKKHVHKDEVAAKSHQLLKYKDVVVSHDEFITEIFEIDEAIKSLNLSELGKKEINDFLNVL